MVSKGSIRYSAKFSEEKGWVWVQYFLEQKGWSRKGVEVQHATVGRSKKVDRGGSCQTLASI